MVTTELAILQNQHCRHIAELNIRVVSWHKLKFYLPSISLIPLFGYLTCNIKSSWVGSTIVCMLIDRFINSNLSLVILLWKWMRKQLLIVEYRDISTLWMLLLIELALQRFYFWATNLTAPIFVSNFVLYANLHFWSLILLHIIISDLSISNTTWCYWSMWTGTKVRSSWMKWVMF